MSQLELPDLLTCPCSSNNTLEQKQEDSVDLFVDGSQSSQPNQTQVNNLEDDANRDTETTSNVSMWANVGIVVGAYLLYKIMRNWR